MKIVCISDSHGKDFSNLIPECDILIHCGDITPIIDHSHAFQKQWYHGTFVPMLKDLPAKNIVFIAGNHDFYLYNMYVAKKENELRKDLPHNIHYLRDNSININNIKIHGTPWIPVLRNWAFYATDSEADSHFSNISSNTDILVSHGPAYGFCDSIGQYNDTAKLGSAPLLEHIIRTGPKYVFCGHIHSGDHNGLTYKGNLQTKFYNVSLLNEDYNIAYKPYETQINEGENT